MCSIQFPFFISLWRQCLVSFTFPLNSFQDRFTPGLSLLCLLISRQNFSTTSTLSINQLVPLVYHPHWSLLSHIESYLSINIIIPVLIIFLIEQAISGFLHTFSHLTHTLSSDHSTVLANLIIFQNTFYPKSIEPMQNWSEKLLYSWDWGEDYSIQMICNNTCNKLMVGIINYRS